MKREELKMKIKEDNLMRIKDVDSKPYMMMELEEAMKSNKS